jgi:hypothetical protein
MSAFVYSTWEPNMSNQPEDQQRRAILNSAAGIAVALATQHSSAAAPAATSAAAPAPVAGKPIPPAAAKPGAGGDFDFLAGHWKISNRRLKQPTDKEWDVFEGEATVFSVLGGMGSIEELRVPARGFYGMGVRVFHTEKKLWADHWVSGKNGVVNDPMMGSFKDGVGTFIADDEDNGKPIKARGVWDRITPTSCRWYQSTSTDGGKTWVDNWFMDWVRV